MWDLAFWIIIYSISWSTIIFGESQESKVTFSFWPLINQGWCRLECSNLMIKHVYVQSKHTETLEWTWVAFWDLYALDWCNIYVTYILCLQVLNSFIFSLKWSFKDPSVSAPWHNETWSQKTWLLKEHCNDYSYVDLRCVIWTKLIVDGNLCKMYVNCMEQKFFTGWPLTRISGNSY